jgi:tripartite-type tricarboxylate transporter receptor subunit TctC
MIIPFAAGGPTDVLGRVMPAKMPPLNAAARACPV